MAVEFYPECNLAPFHFAQSSLEGLQLFGGKEQASAYDMSRGNSAGLNVPAERQNRNFQILGRFRRGEFGAGIVAENLFLRKALFFKGVLPEHRKKPRSLA